MAKPNSKAESAQPAPALPLFYRDPQLLAAQRHADWRIKAGDVSFAVDTPFVPLVVGELAAAARDYPIVFAGDSGFPLAILGLEKANLFVSDGRWAPDRYIPAYVRRYPFGFVETEQPSGFSLAIDAASDRVLQSGDEGIALFDGDKPSEVTLQALEFCRVFEAEAAATRAFAEALRAKALLLDRRADATLPDGRKLGLHGFQIVDVEKFAALDGPSIVEWHAKGWLAFVNFHLASLDRFAALPSLAAVQAKADQPQPEEV